MRVKEIAEIAGISVRTLHHYDAIGLLTPTKDPESGYRSYTDADLEILQQILFFKALDFPLKEIKQIIHHPDYQQLAALQLQRNMLLERSRKLDKMIQMIDQTIAYQKGERNMSHKAKFAGFDFRENPYEQEARDRWGDKAVDKVSQNMRGEKQNQDHFNAIYKRLAGLRHLSPESDLAQAGIKEWYDFLNEIGDYSLDAFMGLGQMYVQDERFTRNIDQFGAGLSIFMCGAMRVFAEENKI